MESVRTRLRLNGDNPCQGLSKFGIVILRGNFRLCNRLQSGIDHDNPQQWVLVIRAIQLERSAAEMLPVDHDLNATLRVFGRGVLPAELRGSRGEQFQAGEIAA